MQEWTPGSAGAE